ncbi:MAG: RNA recognition motif domain-containing protein [Planctomycetota bacterium]
MLNSKQTDIIGGKELKKDLKNLKAKLMAPKLYVGNLSPEANEEVLTALFSMFGTVAKAYIIPDPATGKCKGYGFVVMESEAEAQAAIKALDGKKCGEFTVKVQEAKGK